MRKLEVGLEKLDWKNWKIGLEKLDWKNWIGKLDWKIGLENWIGKLDWENCGNCTKLSEIGKIDANFRQLQAILRIYRNFM